MRPLLSALLTAVLAVFLYMLSCLYRNRKDMENLPAPPRTSWLLGNLPVAADCQDHFPPKTHPHSWCRYIQNKYNLGDFFYLDLWPFGPRWLFITDPDIATQWVTTGQSLNKSPQVTLFLGKLLGFNNMVGLDGPAWKKLRTMFNPGFQTGHLMTLLPYMVDMTVIFCQKLREAAKTGQVIEMEDFAAKLTIDIMGKIVLDADFNAQNAPNAIVETFREQVELMPPASSVNPLDNINFIRPIKLWLNGRKLDRLIGEELDKRFTSSTSQTNGHTNGTVAPKADRKRSVVDLALQTYQKEYQDPSSATAATAAAAASNPSTTRMDPTFRSAAIDQIKTFIFAGHDTTSSTVAYAFYLLHTAPVAVSRLRHELDTVLGPSPTSPATLKHSPHLINALPYTTAVFKETLRLFPPASTLRYAAPDSALTLTDPRTGLKYPLAGCEVWPAAVAIHRNEKYFPRPLDFLPERFMPASSPEFAEFVATLLPDQTAPPAVHKDSWRPFEKGPRNCIGQELAVLETKVILALTVREFDFRCQYPQVEIEGQMNDGGDGGVRCESVVERHPRWMVEGHRCVQVLKGSAKPMGNMPGVVMLR